jgi:hypothetical protein
VIQSAANYQLKEAMGAAKMVSGSLTLSALAAGSKWPFVTSNDFELYARPWLEASNSVFMSFLPLVTGDELGGWNHYSESNQDWITKSFKIDGEQPPSPYASIPPAVYSLDMENDEMVQVNATGRLPVVPLWQMSPPPLDPTPVNFNALSAEWFRSAFLSKLPAIGDGTPALSVLNLTLATSDEGSTSPTTTSTGNRSEEPLSLLLSPIHEKPKDNASTVGIVWSMVPWGAYLTSTFTRNVSGVVAVLRSSCYGQLAYGYEIKNNHAFYLGQIDPHEAAYDTYEYVVTLNPDDVVGRGALNGTSPSLASTRSGSDLTSSECTYAFYLYPSPEYEQAFVSDQPLTAALWIGVVFVVLIIAFVVYERFTAVKNNKLVSIAARSNRLIATLFPEGVRERLFAEEENDERNKNGGHQTADQIRALLRDDPLAGARDDDEDGSEVDFSSKPIADLCKCIFPICQLRFSFKRD